jgi:molecular chaperone GrpE (heat shock protein)
MRSTEPDDPVMKSETEATTEPAASGDRWSRLEKIVRGMGRDSLSLVRGQQEAGANLAAIISRMEEFDLAIKGLSQTTWRAAQERFTQAQDTEKHFAGALRELENRVQEEILWQVQRGTLAAIFPALDDMVRVLSQQREFLAVEGREDPFVEAMELVHYKILAGLRMLGLEEIPVEVGVTRFDPKLHEATEPRDVSAADCQAGVPSGTIVGIKRPGYAVRGRVFRPPLVLVKP